MIGLHTNEDCNYIEKGQCEGWAHGAHEANLIQPISQWSWHISSYVSTWRVCGVLVEGWTWVYAIQHPCSIHKVKCGPIFFLLNKGRKLHMKRMLDRTIWSRLFSVKKEDISQNLLQKEMEDLAPFMTRDMVLDTVRCAIVHILCSFLFARGTNTSRMDCGA